MSKLALAIHGGAGTILRSQMSPDKEAIYRTALDEALEAGYKVLRQGGAALDAVVAAVVSLEDCEWFNAGKGSVFTHQGHHEMDAAVMDGQTGRAGAVAGVRQIKNPILLAQSIMDHSDHILLSGDGAMAFAREHGLAFEDDAYFYTPHRYKQWQQALLEDRTLLDHDDRETDNDLDEKKFGTVGAVACDAHGHLAAATSTGGMTNKKYNRIGDSPLIGCGTYANNSTCAVSCTGHGEKFIQAVAAYDVHCLMEYKGLDLPEALRIVVNEKLLRIRGEGGIIGVDAGGNTAMIFNSEGMYRGRIDASGLKEIAIYK
ncbi:MAG: isoaspartyl peptidase/L-asparaginase [Chitinophagaceae bacterium]|nr:isoaspartyl peptidase/L-asparaginase [Chitinophagaceae bacterium]